MKSDPFEQTATAPQASGTAASLQPGTVFDHFVIERELGSGGMGIVYAALDVDLQRRVAVKVLRAGLAQEAHKRLLREARAMAKLTHPNVVTVFEVGSANGRDFVAMELFDGQSVAEWLREAPRSRDEILATFVAAGRGLAAAHAAGIVHRDFKPHNVLRGGSGRVAVTDFGLARDTTDPLATTLPSGGDSPALAVREMTVTGSVLGTPAYMAPEQWSGGRLTEATDQFAFCVALWEALAGERPYRGTTLDQLREQVTRGPSELADGKLPRPLRAVLRRGLAPDPAARWPSMDALLAKLAPRSYRFAPVVAGVAALAAIAVIVVIATREDAPSSTCPAPALDPATIASGDLAAWHAQRASACAAPQPTRDAQLACLDRVLARIDAVARVGKLAPDVTEAARVLVVDPRVCGRERSPALPARYSDEAVAALALRVGARLDPSQIDRVRAAAATDACVEAYLALYDAQDAEAAARRCRDETALAELELRRFDDQAADLDDAELVRRARDAQRTIEQAGKAELGWRIERTKANAYFARRRYDDALVSFDAAIAAAPQREGASVMAYKAEVLVERARPGDLALARKEIATWRRIAAHLGETETVERLDWRDATAQWMQGDIAGAGPRLRELHAKAPMQLPGTKRIEGVVVDAKGAPVANAIVAAGYSISGDPASIATPLASTGNMLRSFEIATADAAGKFAIAAPSCYGIVVAGSGRLRSRPLAAADGVRLVVEPTITIRGRVELGGRVGTFLVGATTMSDSIGSAGVLAPIASDGTFQLDGVLPGDVLLGVLEGLRTTSTLTSMQRVRIDPKRPPQDLALELPAGREVRVLLRGTGFPGAPVFAVTGKFTGKTIRDLFAFVGNQQMATTMSSPQRGKVPEELATTYKPGDLVATFATAPMGRATICTMLPMRSCETDVPIVCVEASANAAVVLIEK